MAQTSSTFNVLIYFLGFISVFPQTSTQQAVQNGTCAYGYDSTTGLYSCRLTLTIMNKADTFTIKGTHLSGKTDSDVKIVRYSGVTFVDINGEIMRKFDNLEVLRLDTVGMKEIKEDAFESCTNLVEYVSGVSDVTTYPPQMMQNCQKLKVFKAMSQQYFQIPEIFGSVATLEELRITSNPLESLPDNFLQNMPNLRVVNIRENFLTELAPNFFENCPNLEEVDVSYNQFEDQEKLTRAFNKNINIKKLLIDSNRFKSFDFTFFARFEKLEILSASGLGAAQISWQSLSSSLTTLTIESVGVEIPENAFSHLINLSTLSLDGSGITSLHKDTFKSQTELKILSIQSTGLKVLHPELFASQSNLIDLQLRYNQIEELPAGIFASLANLGQENSIHGLKMASNKIKRLNANSFGEHPNLQYLDFSSNQIDAIEREIFSKFSSFMYRANFNSNVCVNKMFSDMTNLHEDESLQWCFDSWEGKTTAIPTTTSITSATTPGAAGSNFKKFEIFVIIFVGFAGILINFVH